MTRSEIWGAWIYLFIDIFFLPTAFKLINASLSIPLSDGEMNFVYFLINFLCLVVICRRFLLKSLKNAISQPFRCLKAAFWGFLLLQFCQFVVGYIILLLQPDFINENNETLYYLTQQNRLLMRIGVIALVPLAEEILFRGLIFRELYERNKVAAYIVSAAVFSAIHLVGYLHLYDPFALLLSFVQYLPAGLCLAWAYVKSDTIIAPILIHMTVNQIGILAVG